MKPDKIARTQQDTMSFIVTNTQTKWMLAVLLCGMFLETSFAFVTSSKISSPRLADGGVYLFVESSGDGGIMDGMGKYSKEVIESSKQNKWGIPDAELLDPLSPKPLEELANGER